MLCGSLSVILLAHFALLCGYHSLQRFTVRTSFVLVMYTLGSPCGTEMVLCGRKWRYIESVERCRLDQWLNTTGDIIVLVCVLIMFVLVIAH